MAWIFGILGAIFGLIYLNTYIGAFGVMALVLMGLTIYAASKGD